MKIGIENEILKTKLKIKLKLKIKNEMYPPHRTSFVKDEKWFQISLLLVPIVNLNKIQWNSTFFMTLLIAIIHLFKSFKFKQTSVWKIGENWMKQENVNLETLYRFQ